MALIGLSPYIKPERVEICKEIFLIGRDLTNKMTQFSDTFPGFKHLGACRGTKYVMIIWLHPKLCAVYLYYVCA